ncbi:hypothetical protein C8F01DRAFT_1105133 [Mycena amicta]|nr:hypothetical protein C8F01DRAFT_1105133 [Mycena amicta]
MEAQKYDRIMAHPPGSQKARLHEQLPSGLTLNSRPIRPRGSQIFEADSDDEIDCLSPKASQSKPDISDVLKTLKFNKNKKSADGAVPTSKENAGVVERKAGGDTVCAAESSTRPLRDNSSRRNSSPESSRSTSQSTREASTSKRRVPPTKSALSIDLAGDDDDEPSTSRRKKREIGGQSSIPQLSPNARGTTRPQPRRRTVEKPSTQPFPMQSPLRGSKGKEKEVEKPVKSTFPAPSPLRTQADKTKKKRLASQPFPMDSEEFRRNPSPGKRRSSGMESEEEPEKKRTRNTLRLSVGAYEHEDDSLFMDPNTDPKTLCPYCDTALPPDPTPYLQKLLEKTFKKSQRDPRPTNPLGRKAPMASFVTVCQRHRFESETLPEAEAKGWPKRIDWEDVRSRVQAMEWDLRRIVHDGGDGETDLEEGSQGKKGPRTRLVLKGVQGVQAQFASFHKTQPGYYGEMGSVIIHQALYDMFPLTAIEPELVDPLTPNEFIQRILVPEVGMRASYGVAMFPDDSGRAAGDDDGPAGVGEQLIMERAMRRRLELEAEEREEEEMARKEAQKKKKTKKGKERRRAKEDEVDEVPAERPRPRPRPKPKPKQKNNSTSRAESAASGMDSDSGLFSADFGSPAEPQRTSDDDLSVGSPASPAPATVTKRSGTVASSDADMDLCSTDSASNNSDVARAQTTTAAPATVRKLTARQKQSSEDDDDNDATPRARHNKAKATIPLSLSTGDFRPLDAARNRVRPLDARASKSSGKKTDMWLTTMAMEPDDDDDDRPPNGSHSSDSWLLGDIS